MNFRLATTMVAALPLAGLIWMSVAHYFSLKACYFSYVTP